MMSAGDTFSSWHMPSRHSTHSVTSTEPDPDNLPLPPNLVASSWVIRARIGPRILTCRGLLPPLQPLLSPPPELFLEADQLTGHVESILVDCSLKIPPHSTAATMRMLTDRPGTTYLGPSAKSTVESSENISSKDEDPTSPSNVEIPPMDAAAQIEEELDLDLDDLKIDESIDPADVNIDDLLSDD
ncbi:hypothetical protein GQR58_013198 [Nymphon striatum]|nr:hypothetical protein GQR58_013198 [Nymphon striatum]